jgi:hypothetical protein
MGDVGSGYLGYVIAVLALASTRDNPIALWVWLILGGVFFVDATVTLVRRVIRGEPIHQAHRSHAYQWLARRWESHRWVTVAIMMLNFIWLLPCAFLVTLHPDHAVAIVVVALVPLVALAIAAGSGRGENTNSALLFPRVRDLRQAPGDPSTGWASVLLRVNLNPVRALPDCEASDGIASVQAVELLSIASDCCTIAPRLRPSYR